MVLHSVISDRDKIKPKKRVLNWVNPIPYFEVVESECHGGFTQLGGIFEKITILR